MSPLSAPPQTLFEKLWASHVVADLGGGYSLIFVDRHTLNDMAGRSFLTLEGRDLPLAHPELTFATADHMIATLEHAGPEREVDNPYVLHLRQAAQKHGFRSFDIDDLGHGIIHIVAAEQGLALPGTTIACGDSHTCTLGAFGALGWGVGQSENVHILATQTSIQTKPKAMRITVIGSRESYITAKDIALHLIGKLGVAGGVGHAIEFAGPVISAMTMEERLTLCNLSIELGARFGLVAPDETTFAYLKDRPFAPKGAAFDTAVADWCALGTDPGAVFDKEAEIDITGLEPQVTWGVSPEHVGRVGDGVPTGELLTDEEKAGRQRALDYIGLEAGQSLRDVTIDMVFIGSCTNSRISDLRAAADVVRGRRVASWVTAWVSPGSRQVADQAEAEGLKAAFVDAGFKWGSPGCSMCGGGGDRQREIAAPLTRLVSTTNRNFIGRQGPGSRTHLASPPTAAAAAIAGRIVDVRDLESLDG